MSQKRKIFDISESNTYNANVYHHYDLPMELALNFNLSVNNEERVADGNNLCLVLEPDVSRGDKLYTAMSWDDTGFLVNLRIQRTKLATEKRKGRMVLLPFQCSSCFELALPPLPSLSSLWHESRN